MVKPGEAQDTPSLSSLYAANKILSRAALLIVASTAAACGRTPLLSESDSDSSDASYSQFGDRTYPDFGIDHSNTLDGSLGMDIYDHFSPKDGGTPIRCEGPDGNPVINGGDLVTTIAVFLNDDEDRASTLLYANGVLIHEIVPWEIPVRCGLSLEIRLQNIGQESHDVEIKSGFNGEWYDAPLYFTFDVLPESEMLGRKIEFTYNPDEIVKVRIDPKEYQE